MKGYIYKYTFPDGKVYIGQTKNLENRKRQHLDPSSGPTNTGFWEAYQRFGTFEFEVIKELEYEYEDELSYYMNLWENGYIYQYKADNPLYGYNKLSFSIDKSKKKMMLQNKYDEVLSSMLQIELLPYLSAKHKIWKTKEPLTAEEVYLVTQKYKKENPFRVDFDFNNLSNNDLDGNEEIFLDDYLEFIRYMIVKDTKEKAAKYIYDNIDSVIKEEMDKVAIVQIDKNDNVVREFHSPVEICQAFNLSRIDNIRNVLRGKQKTAYGYYWRYKKDM
ncbi:MAG: GIY-YIG nuclease family protein [Prevotella sp.]|nr:GIY-YIG nuclease family protein [Prevotella sp.]